VTLTKRSVEFYIPVVFFVGIAITLAVIVSCGGGSSSMPSQPTTTGTVTTSISDPPTCAAPNGGFQNVWITITKVTAHINSDASPSDSGWVTLVDLTTGPKQIDLLSLASTTCLLTNLGSTTGLPPGKYQQIRVLLLSNSPSSGQATPSPNQCGSGGFNCVVGSDGSTKPLLLSSEAQTGIKIPPGQITGGAINLQAGQSADLNIDFNACESIVTQGNGKYRLKPTLHAGEVSLNSNSISGRVVASMTSPTTPIPGALVFLEQPDPNNANLDRVVQANVSASDGTFIFCPLPAGNYDMVVDAMTSPATGVGSATTYAATVTLKVPLGTNVGDIPLIPQPVPSGGSPSTSTLPGMIGGLVTTTSVSPSTGTDADVSVSALQSVGAGSPLLVTIPAFPGSTLSVSTSMPLPSASVGTSCGTGTSVGCAPYTLSVPAGNPQVGTFSSSPPTSYTPPAALPAIYWVNAQATVPMSASSNPGSPDCNPSSLPTTFDSSTQLTVTPGNTTSINFAFTACQ
jgi:uncharacterized protein DUF4382